MYQGGWYRGKFALVVCLSQVAFIILFGCFVDYGWDGTPVSLRTSMVKESEHTGNGSSPVANHVTEQDLAKPKMPIDTFYGMFQDVHVMIFVGFGFLMTFLRKYGYGSVGFNFLMASMVIQWSTILRGFYRFPENNYRIRVDMNALILNEYTAATLLISLGVVVGKLSPVQYVIMVLIETVLVTVNEWISYEKFFIKDVGGTITIHLFGAFFGLALARTIHRKEWSLPAFNDLKFATQYSDLFSLVGTLFLWMFWPSFNAALAVEDGRYRAVFNTYFAISASCLGAYMVSSLVHKEKFSLDIVQNSTLAGGVIVGSICDLYLYPYGALICGFCAGTVSALGFRYLSPIMDSKLGFHDTCGVNNLHAIPSFLGALISAIVAGCATKEVYGSGYYKQFPAHVPPADTKEYLALKHDFPDLEPGLGWGPSTQAGYQLAAMAMTLAISIAGGIVTGLVLRLPIWNQPDVYGVMSHDPHWIDTAKLSKRDEDALRNEMARISGQKTGNQVELPVGLVEKQRNGSDSAHRDSYIDRTEYVSRN